MRREPSRGLVGVCLEASLGGMGVPWGLLVVLGVWAVWGGAHGKGSLYPSQTP